MWRLSRLSVGHAEQNEMWASGGAFYLRGSVTSTNTVTVYVCGTGTPSTLAYNVAVF